MLFPFGQSRPSLLLCFAATLIRINDHHRLQRAFGAATAQVSMIEAVIRAHPARRAAIGSTGVAGLVDLRQCRTKECGRRFIDAFREAIQCAPWM
jgi:hypothetical protein